MFSGPVLPVVTRCYLAKQFPNDVTLAMLLGLGGSLSLSFVCRTAYRTPHEYRMTSS